MIKNILYVEDGSVDVDELEKLLGEETKIIVYRQGGVIPKLEQVNPINTKRDDTLDEIRNICEKCMDEIERNDERIRGGPFYENPERIYSSAMQELVKILVIKENNKDGTH